MRYQVLLLSTIVYSFFASVEPLLLVNFLLMLKEIFKSSLMDAKFNLSLGLSLFLLKYNSNMYGVTSKKRLIVSFSA